MPGRLGRGVAIGPLPAAFVTQFAQGSALRLADREGREIGSWTVTAGRPAAEALAYCETEKQVEWGADRAGFEPGAVAARPASNPSSWLTVRDFGLVHALAQASYTAVFRLVLDQSGAPTGCTLLEFAGNVESRARSAAPSSAAPATSRHAIRAAMPSSRSPSMSLVPDGHRDPAHPGLRRALPQGRTGGPARLELRAREPI